MMAELQGLDLPARKELVALVTSNDRANLTNLLHAASVSDKKAALSEHLRGMSLLNLAIECDALDCAAYLLEQGLCNVDEQDASGATALHAACSDGNLKAVKFLLEWKAKLSARDDRGEAPLHMACYFGHDEVVDLLCTNGAYIDVQSDTNRTPLHAATVNRQLKCIALLVNRGADVSLTDSDGKTAAELANGDPEVLSCFQTQAYQRLEDIGSLQSKLKRLASQLEDERERSREKDVRMGNAYKQMKSMEDDARQAQQHLRAVSQQLEEKERECQALREAAAREAQQKSEWEKRCQELQTVSDSLQQAQQLASRLQEELEVEKQARAREAAERAEQLAEKEMALQALGGVIEAQQAETEGLKSALQLEQKKLETVTTDLNTRLASFEALNKQVLDLKETKLYLQQQLLAAESKIVAATANETQYQQALQTLQQQIQQQQQQIQHLSQRLALQSQQPSTGSAPTGPALGTVSNTKAEEELERAKGVLNSMGMLVTIANTALSEATAKLAQFAAAADSNKAPSSTVVPSNPQAQVVQSSLPSPTQPAPAAQ